MVGRAKALGGIMERLGHDRILRVMAMTRFHFIAGLPGAGGPLLAGILRQNPRFLVGQDGRAEAVFRALAPLFDRTGKLGGMLDAGQRAAILRGVVDGIYNERPLEAVVFDLHHGWLMQLDRLAALFPLSRVLVPIRNPAMIVEAMLRAEGAAQEDAEARAEAIMAPDGPLGGALGVLRNALMSRHSERLLLVDQDRLMENPTEAMGIVAHFLREEAYEYDFSEVSVVDTDLGETMPTLVEVAPQVATPLLSLRKHQKLSGRAFWRNLRRTNATMMLRHAP